MAARINRWIDARLPEKARAFWNHPAGKFYI